MHKTLILINRPGVAAADLQGVKLSWSLTLILEVQTLFQSLALREILSQLIDSLKWCLADCATA